MTDSRKRLGFILAIAMMLALALPWIPSAKAQTTPNNGDLEITEDGVFTNEREYHVASGTTQTVTATLGAPATSPTTVHIEHESGLTNADGNTRQTPDFSCQIPSGSTSCITTISKPGSAAGVATYRAWIDSDNITSTDNSDTAEGYLADEKECTEARAEGDTGAGGTGPCNPTKATPGNGCFTGDLKGQDPTEEYDCTDVFRINWTQSDLVPTTLDCDDSGPPDTERETKGSSTDDAVSAETYTCVVRNQNGQGVNGVQVKGEVKNGVNDPDATDGASYESPDYGCVTDFVDPIFGSGAGTCEVTVEQLENELGTAIICFWVGTTSEGQTLCTAEQTGTGPDAGDNLADQVELTWVNPDSFVLDCSPESDSNPAGSSHTVTCRVTTPGGNPQPVRGYVVNVEYTGANDPDSSNSPQVPDNSCTSGENGECSFTHGPGTTSSTGTTTYRAWIDDGIEPTDDPSEIPPIGVQNEDRDDTEGRDENASPGRLAEPDSTDVVEKTWTPAPATIDVQPPTDSGIVGDCNPFTATVTNSAGQPVQGIVLDVEQIHANSTRAPAGDSPAVDFCIPSSGQNPSDVDTSRGDLGPDSTAQDRENPDDPGTAGGETTVGTNSNGVVTFGITVTPANGSNGSGQVNVTAWWDPDEDDDPDSNEPKDTAVKNWAAQAGSGGRAIDCEPETATNPTGTEHTVTCTVTNASGQPQSGADVTFTETGPGQFTSATQQTTGTNGQASATVTSDDPGTQTITGTLTNSTQNEPDTDECDRPANDPQGAQAGSCSDSVEKIWEGEPKPECDDGEDNDGDGQIDHPDDPGCQNPNDDDESDDPVAECPGYEGDPRNQTVGTEDDDQLVGTNGADIICGLGGNDDIDGLGGDDVILGGDGNDSLRGGDGDDEIYGEGDKDEMRGNDGDDFLDGGDQNDVAYGNNGNDKMVGRSGFDVLKGGSGNDVGKGNGGRDTLQGFTGKDKLIGGGGVDVIKGGNGGDRLKGGGGNDTIAGNKGRDRIDGGSGRDTCSGGPGRDRVRNCERGSARRSGR